MHRVSVVARQCAGAGGFFFGRKEGGLAGLGGQFQAVSFADVFGFAFGRQFGAGFLGVSL